MRKRWLLWTIIAMVLLGLASRAAAQVPQREMRPPETKASPVADSAAPKEEFSVTDHTIRIGSLVIPYKATAGTTLLRDDKGEPTGLIYAVAYTRSDVKDLSARPVAFFYNGGPGSAFDVAAHGRVRTAARGHGGRRLHPARRPTNWWITPRASSTRPTWSLSTPWGRAIAAPSGKAQNKDFYGIDEDVQAFAQFITTYVSRNNRWNSPKFLVGESYGTFRSAALGNASPVPR